MAGTRTGLFGGTFDPPHRGHVAALGAAWATGWFDRILVTVAGDPYHKASGDAPAARRLAMAHAAFDGLAGVEVSDVEITRGGPTYTYDTASALVARGDEVTLLLGADAVREIDNWHRADELAHLVRLAIFPRDGTPLIVTSQWRHTMVPMDPVDLSSTQVRSVSRDSPALAQWLAPAVLTIFLRSPG